MRPNPRWSAVASAAAVGWSGSAAIGGHLIEVNHTRAVMSFPTSLLVYIQKIPRE
jgi:hypothetical protein